MLNLVVPGLGQLFLKARARGVIMITGAAACTIWFVIEATLPIFALYRDEFPEKIEFHYGYMLASLVLLAIIWLWSIADIISRTGSGANEVAKCGKP